MNNAKRASEVAIMKQRLKTLVKNNVSPQAYKAITEIVDAATSTWRLATRPFNGQCSRQDLFHSLIKKFAPIAIVETGTYLATTTEFMAKTGLPIFSVESDPRNYGLARARLWWHRNVHLQRGDSRAALRTLFDGPLRGARDHNLLIYLDAHWKEDLPLAEELEIIFSGFPNAVVMVDDFHVPFDSGYGYDDYGAGRSLTADYIEPIVAAHGLRVFYPSTPSAHETGARRGCVILAKKNHTGTVLTSLPLLQEAQRPSGSEK